ncbi:hypothetical protein RDV64_17520 [Acuticoccus sp. MNP-M23]|uniref:hypothetical protein n=1 Tax=Acuticoccus sp. MNP-M23 TaxID=3072793 RepID=UPI0028157E56|nr:hypothetical protein [Acuticoccus sp. MNP-M23]WMS41849.1 hypothetical protein RDV64_17520 [Acuticoccus sp. MNP-M23]
MADDVIVMCLGRIVQSVPVAHVVARPAHPYPRALLLAVPPLDPRQRNRLLPLGESVQS